MNNGVLTVDFTAGRRCHAPLLRERLPELGADVITFEARCPHWCIRDDKHTRHLAGTGAIGSRTPGRTDLVTVLLTQEHGTALVDLRALSGPDHIGALLNADALDDVIDALTTARRLMAASSPRSLPHGGGRASTSGRGETPRCSPARATPLESA